MDLTSQTDQKEDNQEFVQNLHLLQIKDENVDNQIELNCSLILTKPLELLIINKNLQSIEAFDKCIENVDYLREFLSGFELSQQNNLLQRAYDQNHTLLVKFLLESNPNSEVKLKTITELTPLHFACQEGYVGFVKTLIGKKANLEAQDNDKNKPLNIAAKNNKKQCAFYLLEKILNKSNIHPEPDLVKFFCFGNEDLLLEALKTSTELIHIVAAGGNLSLLQNLIDQEGEANVSTTDIYSRTPLELAIKYGHTRVAEFMISNNANIEAKDHNQNTPLHLAIEAGQDDVVKDLIAKKEEKEKNVKRLQRKAEWQKQNRIKVKDTLKKLKKMLQLSNL